MVVVAAMVDETTLNLPAPLERPRNRYDAVTAFLGDRLRAGNVPEIEAFSPHASRSLQTDRSDTFCADTTRGADYWYLLYWNELTDEHTLLDLSTAMSADYYARHTTLSAIRSGAGFDNATNRGDPEVK
ncbi:hypothetical protein ACRQ4B_17580 [Curtobacterium sp. SP.BCo]|uniref:hypothetical protein n=1 Tax=Curtobacterium sp. SP.BCo TaxID=3435229 RepID=UPI003F73C149